MHIIVLNVYLSTVENQDKNGGNQKDADSLFVMTRSMAKAEGAAVAQMYPLQGDHKRPEVSQTGMIQTQAPIQQR